MEKVYCLLRYDGTYDSSSTSVVSVFTDKDVAVKECKHLNDNMDGLFEKIRSLCSDEEDVDHFLSSACDLIDNKVAIGLLKTEYPSYYDFYKETDGLNKIKENDEDVELCNKICEILFEKYPKETDKLYEYTLNHYDKTTAEKVKVYSEYLNSCSYGDIYEGLPSYGVTDEPIPLYR